jgi:hypothetical protein
MTKIVKRFKENAKEWKKVIPQTIATRKSELTKNHVNALVAKHNYDKKELQKEIDADKKKNPDFYR